MPSSTTASSTTKHIDRNQPWQPMQASLLESMLTVPDLKPTDIHNAGMPWQRGHELSISGSGGVRELEDRHVVIAASRHGSWVGGNLTKTVTGDGALDVAGDLSVSVSAPAQGTPGHAASQSRFDNVPWGEEKLTVNGQASVDLGDRRNLIQGAVRRDWQGAIVRLASMEGVICAGLHLRMFVGVSASMSLLTTGDVYGGAARAAVARMHMGKMVYRSADLSAWVGLAYIRSTTATIEPVIGTPTKHIQGGMLMKLGKLTLKLCPILDILWGVAMLLATPFILIVGAIKAKLGKAKPPPVGNPRLRNRTVGVIAEMNSADIIM